MSIVFDAALLRDVACDAAGLREFAVTAQDARHEDVAGGPILAAQARRIVANQFVAPEPREDVLDRGRIVVKRGDVVTDVLTGGESEQLELGGVCPKNRPVGADPVHRVEGVVQKIVQIAADHADSLTRWWSMLAGGTAAVDVMRVDIGMRTTKVDPC